MKGYDFCCPKHSKTINQWDARDAPMKSIEGTCQDWLQLLTGGITQDALHMHSATVALVAAPAICCLHLNMLHVTHVHWLRQNAHRSVLRFQTFFLHFGFSKSHSPQGWAKGPDNPQEVDSPEGWTLAKSWAANCLSEGKNIVFYCFSQVTFVKIQKNMKDSQVQMIQLITCMYFDVFSQWPNKWTHINFNCVIPWNASKAPKCAWWATSGRSNTLIGWLTSHVASRA